MTLTSETLDLDKTEHVEPRAEHSSALTTWDTQQQEQHKDSQLFPGRSEQDADTTMPDTIHSTHKGAQGNGSIANTLFTAANAVSHQLRFGKDVMVLNIGDLLALNDIQSHFNDVPRDPYVKQGFRYKSIVRVYSLSNGVQLAEHGPLYQPKGYNPVHGGLARHYEQMPYALTKLISPAIQVFATCAQLRATDEILVQAQRITATSGDDGRTGYPVVEGWHQDNIDVLGILLVNRQNISGGISLVARDSSGADLVFAQPLHAGELLLTNDRNTWHNTTPIRQERPGSASFRDIVIFTSPSNRETDRLSAPDTVDVDYALLGIS